jgi:hypothetical protein
MQISLTSFTSPRKRQITVLPVFTEVARQRQIWFTGHSWLATLTQENSIPDGPVHQLILRAACSDLGLSDANAVGRA